MKKRISWMLCLIVVTVSIQAQTISGKLVDEKNAPLAYTNIVLQQADSTFVSGQTSNEKGDFRFQKVTEGDYRLVISSIGYQTLYIDLQGFNRSADLGTLTMLDASQQLGEVTVTASNMVGTADRKLVFPNKKQVVSTTACWRMCWPPVTPARKCAKCCRSAASAQGDTLSGAVCA